MDDMIIIYINYFYRETKCVGVHYARDDDAVFNFFDWIGF